MGVDSGRFTPKRETRKAKRRELGIPADAFHIVTAAELNENKNQKIIIDAVPVSYTLLTLPTNSVV
ncbi:MAG: hypothetical protein K2K54_11240 [Lachnospiraceae bacterium]|nr:hypothetical protein [Lachnospiraceae bacterium]